MNRGPTLNLAFASMNTLVFFPPVSPEIRSPDVSVLKAAFLNSDYAFWSRGESDAALEVLDESNEELTRIMIFPGAPGQFCLNCSSDADGELVITVNSHDHEIVSICDGKNAAIRR